MVEIALRARFHTIGSDPGLGDIEIDFHYPPLAPDAPDQEGEPGFKAFAQLAPALPKDPVSRGLLTDR